MRGRLSREGNPVCPLAYLSSVRSWARHAADAVVTFRLAGSSPHADDSRTNGLTPARRAALDALERELQELLRAQLR